MSHSLANLSNSYTLLLKPLQFHWKTFKLNRLSIRLSITVGHVLFAAGLPYVKLLVYPSICSDNFRRINLRFAELSSFFLLCWMRLHTLWSILEYWKLRQIFLGLGSNFLPLAWIFCIITIVYIFLRCNHILLNSYLQDLDVAPCFQ